MITFRVEGMHCGRCVARINQAVRDLDAGAEVRVDLAAGTVSVDSSRNAAELSAALARIGYPARPVVPPSPEIGP
ncbi:MAG: heavy-metal-associated domain-containing protein [Arenimonas sp.]